MSFRARPSRAEQERERSLTIVAMTRADGAAPDHVALALRELGVRYLVAPNKAYGAASIFRAAGLPHPLPEPVARLVAFGEAARVRVVALGSSPLERQWNPYSGAWYLARTVPKTTDHRFAYEHVQRGALLLFDAAHELTHASVATVALAGLLSRLDADGRARLHATGEAMAVLVGDLELPSAIDSYLRAFWPPATQLSHAVAANPSDALAAAGVDGADARAAWVRSLYLDGGRALPRVPDAPADRARALACLYEEHLNATKAARTVQPSWQRGDWSAPEIAAWIDGFVPKRAPIVRVHGEARVIESVDDLWSVWRALTVAWEPQPDHDVELLEVQRAALKIAELARAFASPRLLVGDGARDRGSARIEEARRVELEAFAAPRGEARARVAALAGDLAAIVGAPHLVFVHPAVTGEAMDDRASAGDLARAGQCDAKALAAVAAFVDDEASTELEITGRAAAAELAAEGRLHALRAASDVEAARAWAARVVTERRLLQAVPLAWSTERPFVDPCVGFRHR